MSLETSAHFDRLLEFFYKKTGIFFSEKRSIVAQRVEDFFGENSVSNYADYIHTLENNAELYQKLVNLLTVNETYFFREARAIEIFAELASKHAGKFRVLCLPCSTGEEPYTLSIALQEAGIDPSRYEIVGIDINSTVIDEAKKGVYRSRSLYRTDENIREKYFEISSEGFVHIKPQVSKSVQFQVCNLFEPCVKALGSFDFLFCRNLLIYFDQTSRLKAEKVLFDTLKNGGFLFTGHADLIKNDVGFKKHFDHGTLYYEKSL